MCFFPDMKCYPPLKIKSEIFACGVLSGKSPFPEKYVHRDSPFYNTIFEPNEELDPGTLTISIASSDFR